jgi:hypothetical protein
MANPLGQGERNHPSGGNTTLVTYDLKGNKVSTSLWINQFATDLNMQLDSAQGKAGLIHRPIRMTERFLTFSTLWNVNDRPKYVDLIRKIREHWAFNLNDNRDLKPMSLRYYGANKTWLGFIENADIGYAVTDVVLTYSFQMRLIPNVAQVQSTVNGIDAPYAPTSQDAKNYGPQWYKIGEFIAAYVGVGNEGKNGARNGTKDPITGQGHGPVHGSGPHPH